MEAVCVFLSEWIVEIRFNTDFCLILFEWQKLYTGTEEYFYESNSFLFVLPLHASLLAAERHHIHLLTLILINEYLNYTWLDERSNYHPKSSSMIV